MSTILNALKKLEQESRAEEAQHPPALNIHLRRERNLWKEKHSWAAKGRKSLLWAVLPALLLLGTFALFTGQFQEETPPTKTEPMPPPMQLPLVKEMAIPPKASLPMESTPLIQERMIPLAVPPAKPVESPPRKKVKAALPKRAETKAEEPLQPRHDKVDTGEVMVQALDKEIRLLGDGTLKINAISWSQQADERLAVINSAIVREGQTVEGFRLVRILEDGVIVQRAGQKSRVEFRLR